MEIDFDDLVDQTQDYTSAEAHPETARILSELDRKVSARRIAVPTKDLEVRIRLREMGEPITLYGERPEDRRDRLREVISTRRDRHVRMDESEESEDSGIEDEEKEEEFYTEGTMELKQARRDIAEFSIER